MSPQARRQLGERYYRLHEGDMRRVFPSSAPTPGQFLDAVEAAGPDELKKMREALGDEADQPDDVD
jgi:hypothetical protein